MAATAEVEAQLGVGLEAAAMGLVAAVAAVAKVDSAGGGAAGRGQPGAPHSRRMPSMCRNRWPARWRRRHQEMKHSGQTGSMRGTPTASVSTPRRASTEGSSEVRRGEVGRPATVG